MSPDYSKTPLARKLGIKENNMILIHQSPGDYFNFFKDFPLTTIMISEWENASVDFVHIFCKTKEDFHKSSLEFKKAMKKSGMMWVSWPKGKSSIQTDLNRDYIREYLLNNGLVDVKVASVNDDWSALKFVYRLKDR